MAAGSKARREAPRWFAPVFVLFLSAMTVVFDAAVGTTAVRQISASSYATTPGTILESKVTRSKGRKGTTYRARVSYRYSVAGVEHTAKRWRYGAMSASSDEARLVVARYPAGSAVQVHYNPRDPGDAVLVTGLQAQDGMLLLLVTPFNAVMVGGWAVLLRRRVRMGARVWEEGGVTRVRVIGMLSPLFVGLGVLSLSCCLGIFVVVLGFGLAPSLTVPLGTWGLAATAGAAAGLVRRAVVASGRGDLVIDAVARTLTLPARFEKSGGRDVPLVALKGVDVLDVNLKHGTASNVSLRIDGRGGAVEVARQIGPAQADALAAWLRERLELPAAVVKSEPGVPVERAA